MNKEKTAMLIKTSIALAAAAFLGLASVASASDHDQDSKYRQTEGFSSSVGPLGQYFGSRAPLRRGYYYGYGYGYGPYGYGPRRRFMDR
jgi:hypothetical protein